MRWMVLLCLLAGCASVPEDGPDTADEFFAGDVDYGRARPRTMHPPGPGWIVADLTVVDMQIEAAERLLGIKDAADIAPRANDRATGEIAAGLAVVHEAGEILARDSMALELGASTPFDLEHRIFYVADWCIGPSGMAPIILEAGLSTAGAFTVTKMTRGGYSIQADTTALQMDMQMFTTSLGQDRSDVLIANPVQTRRVGVETVGTDQTAAFQLGRVATGERPRIRLLFVRIAESDS